MASELILHHYDFSSYSEKVRLVLGLKGLTWRSVEISPVLPKPDYMPHTRGYRRAPALQIRAGVFCKLGKSDLFLFDCFREDTCNASRSCCRDRM